MRAQSRQPAALATSPKSKTTGYDVVQGALGALCHELERTLFEIAAVRLVDSGSTVAAPEVPFIALCEHLHQVGRRLPGTADGDDSVCDAVCTREGVIDTHAPMFLAS
jgi:hypothetical protein